MVNKSSQASTIIEFYIEKDGVRAELEIGISSIKTFKNLLPDEIYNFYKFGNESFLKRQKKFFTQDLAILDQEGKPLEGELLFIGPSKRTLRDSINGKPLPIQKSAPDIIKVTLQYHFKNNILPSQLNFKTPPERDIGFIVYHEGVAVNDFRFLASGHRLVLDWEDPWYSAFESRTLRRQYHSPMSGFIYVEPFEVRKEIIVRPKDIQRWIDLGLSDKKYIPAGMQKEVKEKIAVFLSKYHPVSIDGKLVNGKLQSANFLERTLNSSSVSDPDTDISLNSAIVGVIFVYPRRTLPQKVEMQWDLWDDRIRKVLTSAVDEVGPLSSVLDPEWNILRWENFLKNPTIPRLLEVRKPLEKWKTLLDSSFPLIVLLSILTLLWLVWSLRNKKPLLLPLVFFVLFTTALVITVLFAGPHKPEKEQAKEIVSNLLSNIYRAFDHKDESEIYDVLAKSVSGELLTDIYLQTQRSLVLANQGGAQAKVNDISIQKFKIRPQESTDGFSAEVTWVVNGSVGHWGHIHERSNRYSAEFLVTVIDDQWKVLKMQVHNEERIK